MDSFVSQSGTARLNYLIYKPEVKVSRTYLEPDLDLRDQSQHLEVKIDH